MSKESILMQRIKEISPRVRETDGTDTEEAWELCHEGCRLLVMLADQRGVGMDDFEIVATGEHFFGMSASQIAGARRLAEIPVEQVTGRVVVQ